MPIDFPHRADGSPDDPGHHQKSDEPLSSDSTPLSGPTWAERESAHRDYRAVVDRVDNPWTKARSELQEALDELVARYPDLDHPAPQTRPDGSWTCGDRRLCPDQNTEVSRGYARVRDIGEQDIVPGILAVEAEDPTRHLAGFDRHIKGEDRLKEKIADRIRFKGRTAEQALGEIPDAVRFTYKYEESTYSAGVLDDVKRLQDRGFIQVERRNTWDDDQYKGINARWREPASGVLFEVQFHTLASLEAKELTHKAYERIRSTARDDERAEFKEFQRRVNSMIPIPPGATDIEDYPPGDK